MDPFTTNGPDFTKPTMDPMYNRIRALLLNSLQWTIL